MYCDRPYHGFPILTVVARDPPFRRPRLGKMTSRRRAPVAVPTPSLESWCGCRISYVVSVLLGASGLRRRRLTRELRRCECRREGTSRRRRRATRRGLALIRKARTAQHGNREHAGRFVD